jgi:hypothetical protein
MSKIKNILIFVVIGAVFVLIYIFFIKPKPPVPDLVSSTSSKVVPNTEGAKNDPKVAQDFLNLLLNVKSIKLDDSIFSDSAFLSLHDSSITLIPDGNEGRINPFAPLGTDSREEVVLPSNAVTSPVTLPITCILPKVLNTVTNTCVNLPPPIN